MYLCFQRAWSKGPGVGVWEDWADEMNGAEWVYGGFMYVISFPTNLSPAHSAVDFLSLQSFFSFLFLFFFLRQSFARYPGWSAMRPSRLTAPSASWVQAILLPQPPE